MLQENQEKTLLHSYKTVKKNEKKLLNHFILESYTLSHQDYQKSVIEANIISGASIVLIFQCDKTLTACV